MEIDVKKVAQLARLGISKKEEEKFGRDLSSVLEYFEQLKKVNVSGVPTMYSPSEDYFKDNMLSRDEPADSGISDDLTQKFPAKKGRYNKVKSVFK